MKEETRWKVMAGVALVTLTLLLLTVHFLIFRDSYHLFIYFIGDLAFVPIEVLIVTLIIDQMLESRERQRRMEKLNMVIGIFFSRTGTPLIATFARADPGIGDLQSDLVIGKDWDAGRFREVKTSLGAWQCRIDPSRVDLEDLRNYLVRNEDFLLRLVENPMVFEHESFTDLILAVSHLTEELKARDYPLHLPPADIAHIRGDMERAYSRLVPEWLKYMEYLGSHYPYLFSLAMRTNPFDKTAKVVVEG